MIYPSFFRCMTAFLHGRTVEDLPLSPPEWGKLFHLARRQSLSGALFLATEHTPMPDSVRDRLRRDGFLTLSAYEDRRLAVGDIAAEFDKRQIAHLFFKGTVVGAYYPAPAMRSMGDIDMVIRADDRTNADAAMTSLGFTCTSRSSEVWVYERRELLIEMHTIVRRYDVAAQSPVPYDDLWTNARLQQGHTYHLSDEAEIVHAVHHLVAHFSAGGCGLRMVMDVAVLYRRFADTDVWQAATARLEKDGLLLFTRRLLWFIALALEIEVADADQSPLEEPFAAQFAERLLGGTTFGKDERLLLAAKRRDARRTDGERSSSLKARLLPPANVMRSRYEYAAKHPWLLPAAYVHRAFEGVTKNRAVHKRRRAYAEHAEEELQNDIALFDALGL